ncbi:transposase [Streptomyces sp. NPDC055189]
MTITQAPVSGTRERIRKTALELFCERGYAETSLREISEELGVTKAALYHHFKTKEDILISLAQTVIDDLDGLITWVNSRPRTPETKRELLARYSVIFSDAAPLVAMIQQNHATISELSVGQQFGLRTSTIADLLKEPDASVEVQVRSVSALLTLHFGVFAIQNIEGDAEEKRKALLGCATDMLNSAYPAGSREPFPSDRATAEPDTSLTDAQWARIEPLLPDRTPQRGGRWRDHRQVIDAIACKYRTGCAWMDLPAEYGSWKGVHNRLRKWVADGTWEKVVDALLAGAGADEDLTWVASADSAVAHGPRHAAGARH